MKKIYLNPTTTILKIETINMIATSFDEEIGNSGKDGSAGLSRDYDDWDE